MFATLGAGDRKGGGGSVNEVVSVTQRGSARWSAASRVRGVSSGMKRTGRWITFLSVLAILAALLPVTSQAASDDLLAQIKKRGYMRVGTFSAPPESWIDINSGEWKGIDADFTDAIAKGIGVQVDPIVLVHTEMVPALNSGRLDAIAGLYYTPARAKVMSYNAVPYWYGIDVLVARKDDMSIKSFADLKGKTIGAARGSAQEIEADKLKQKFGVADVKLYESPDPMLMDLHAGRIDAAVWYRYSFDYALKQNPSYDFRAVQNMPPEYLGSKTLPATYYLFKKGPETVTLIHAFDAILRKMIANGASKSVLEKYGLTDPGYWTGKLSP
jgi:polar amino acid transport system substrate-binding protein